MSRKNKVKWGIVLTTTVNVDKVSTIQKNKEERIQTYLASIRQWLLTDLPIIVVENSGYTFPQLKGTRVEVITFKSEEDKEFHSFLKPSPFIIHTKYDINIKMIFIALLFALQKKHH